eukprot:scaffold503_cov81-Cylindrotheca_fusiformis.AAC.2
MTSKNKPPEKCPCCNNPWSLGDDDFMAQFCGACSTTEAAAAKNSSSSSPMANVDTNISPTIDFYLYANNKWIQNNPIPSGYPNWNTFLDLHTKSQERLKDLLVSLANNDNDENENDEKVSNNKTIITTTPELAENGRKLAAFYKAAMDETAIENAGTKPIQPLLLACKETAQAFAAADSSSNKLFATRLGNLLKEYGITAFFSIGGGPDHQNSDHSIVQIVQGGLGMPDRDYYFDEDKQDQRDAYQQHIAKMLSLLDENDDNDDDEYYQKKAKQIYNLEERLAKSHMTKTENRDPEATYHKMSIDDCMANVMMTTTQGKVGFDMKSFLESATNGKELGNINIRNLNALKGVAQVIQSLKEENDDNAMVVMEDYLRWRSIRSCAKYMSNDFVMEDFNFQERILSGTNEIKPRWKRAMAFTEAALGEALGQIYCFKYFDESCKQKALYIVEQVRMALKERLKEVDWMKSESTREQALQKMNRFRIKIGYPDEWIDYSTLQIDENHDDFLSMIFASRRFDHLLEVNKEMNERTDRNKWFMTPQTINAYYHPSLNEIVFPAAILQPPMFDPDTSDMAINFGAIGAVVGHEMTHGFDDKGRKFNFEGNMIDWWTKEDANEYEKRVMVMVKQANAYQVHGQSLKGQLTCGENIADLGGLRLALRALMAQPNFDINQKVEGFNPIQRFFLGWANCWRQNITKERSLQLLTLDPHGPNPMRCNGPLSNMAEFHEAFGVTEDSPMFKPKEARVDIW